MSKIINGVASEYDIPMKYENSTYTVKYAIDKLQQENNQLKEVIEEAREYTKKEIREYKYAIDETTMDSDTEDIYDMVIRNFEKLLQILDKVKENKQ